MIVVVVLLVVVEVVVMLWWLWGVFTICHGFEYITLNISDYM